MSSTDLEALIAATEARLTEALAAIAAGDLVDLADLPQRIAMVCSRAVAERCAGMAERLAGLIARLDEVEQALRVQITGLGGEVRPDPRTAAQSYGAAQQRPDRED
jgi:hypothetical protein